MSQGATSDSVLRYEEVAVKIGGMIDDGVFRPGDRLPSVRGLARQLHASINTVLHAYARLENRGLVEARPRSGHYVRSRPPEPENRSAAGRGRARPVPARVEIDEVPARILRALVDPSLVPLGGGVPSPELLPVDKLNRMLAAECRRHRLQSISYAGAAGLKRLRIQVARRALEAGCALSADDLVVTSGCVEAVTLALQSTCRPGDTVAVGSPVYYTFLSSMQWLGLKVLEIPSSAQEGMSLDVLGYAVRHTPVHACLLISNFNNPLGGVMPDGKKRELVRLLADREIPLIEDDVYGDLAFGAKRPSAAKAFDEKGLVLYCSSFSKTLAPGYRVGWIAPGRFYERVRQLKVLFNIASPSPTQLAVAEFLANGGYDRHLRAICRVYARQVALLRDAVGRHFPLGTRVTRPGGGFVVWVEMPSGVDALRLHEEARREGISVAPGPVFTVGDQFRSCIRLSAAHWSETAERAVETLGGLACGMM